LIPGEIVLADDRDVVGPSGFETLVLEVHNTSDRAIQITSHFHFFEVNRALRFDRAKTIGHRLDVPAGTAVRFEPGQSHTVRLRPYGGAKVIRGFQGLVDGPAGDPAVRDAALRRARERGFIVDEGSG
jgi:urease beta subunit